MHIAKKRLQTLIDEGHEIETFLAYGASRNERNDKRVERALLRYKEAVRLAQEALDASPPWET